MLLQTLVIIYFIGTFFFFRAILAHKLNEEIIARIKEEGLYHITRRELIPYIVDSNGVAHFKPSNRRDSYSNFFRRSVFFFIGKPTPFRCFLNLPRRILKNHKHELVVLHVNGKKLPQEILKNFRWRMLDKVVMYRGELEIPVEVEEFTI